LDSPFPLFFFNRLTSFTSPKSLNVRKISISSRWSGMSPTNNLFPGIAALSGDFEDRSSGLLLRGNLRLFPLELTLEFVSELGLNIIEEMIWDR
jgi:hypothetical protein